MQRATRHCFALKAAALGALVLLTSTGCLHTLLATGVYLWQGGNVVPAQCDALEGERVVVVCRPPASHEYRFAGASSSIGRRVSAMIEQNVPRVEVVSPREVDNWVDEQDWQDFKDLARSVKATRVVYVTLDSFELYKGKTLYQGNTDVTVSVYDMEKGGKVVWDRHLGQVLFPKNSGIPAADKPIQHFQRQFVEIVARQIAVHFYRHDPNADFALDAAANQ